MGDVTQDNIKALARVDPEVWFVLFAVLKDKEGKILPKRKPNILQKRMFAAYRKCMAEGKPCKILGLKPRQVGLSTIVAAITYHHMMNHGGLSGALMADKTGTSDKVFEIFRTLAEHDKFEWGYGPMPKFGEPGNLADEIVLPSGSMYRKETAGSARAGAGGTIQVANATEVAHFPVIKGKDPALGFFNSWYDEGPMSIGMLDTTPNGPTGIFYEMWQNKKNGYIRIFAAWFEFPEHARPFASAAEREAFSLELDDEEKQEIERYHVTLEQLNWRRWKIADKCQNDPNKFRQEYPSNDVECFLLNARLRFKAATVQKFVELWGAIRPTVGELSMQNNQAVSFVPDGEGTVEIIEEPRVGCRYLVSMDTCTGRDQQQSGPKADPDYHSIGVLRDGYRDANGRWWPPRIVAHHWSRLESEYAALVAACLSIYYGRCIVIPEVNNCGIYHVKELQRLEIPVFERTTTNKTAGTVDRMAGWRTDPATKKTIIDNLAGLIAEWKQENPTFECPFMWILEQLAVFVRHKDGTVRAMSGKHDDGVMMLAIALWNRAMATLYRERKRKPVRVEDVNRREGWSSY
ncbi:hypothetical protein [Geminisphaera colitermitum]|uniref:hypothetical protein n=1 Tax=Geminisphaera colitermitum TaxID=1148786 RepID=UPI000158C936|nr:hypothetical protein [Geminisphaera colitermitum]